MFPLICSCHQSFSLYNYSQKNKSESDLEFLLSAAKLSPRAPQLLNLVLHDALTPPDIPAMVSPPRKAVRAGTEVPACLSPTSVP